MGKIKFTKGELKKERDALRQYERFLPTLQLKKQQLQAEILHQLSILEDRIRKFAERKKEIVRWAGLLAAGSVDIKPWLKPKKAIIDVKNVAGVNLPVFMRAEFETAEYDLFLMPLWVDGAVEGLRSLITIVEEMEILNEGIAILRAELRVTTQRVNLFERVKIPKAEEAIRLIKIYIGDQMANAVGRSKIAKRKIETQVVLENAAA
jgi:V/A-type H+-transporting ATPase subunit D